jgi:hypothetical protein
VQYLFRPVAALDALIALMAPARGAYPAPLARRAHAPKPFQVRCVRVRAPRSHGWAMLSEVEARQGRAVAMRDGVRHSIFEAFPIQRQVFQDFRAGRAGI